LIGTVSANIMLVVQMLNILLRMALGLLAVNIIQALRLDKLVDLGAREADEKLLGELVGNGLACSQYRQLLVPRFVEEGGREWRGVLRTFLALTILEEFEGAEGGSSS
jgi:hypothetical protein